MKHKIAIILLIFVLPIAAHVQADYTIPKKHRVIQEKSGQSRDVLVGTKISDITISTLRGKIHSLTSLSKQGPVVFVFLSAECPVAQRYAMRLKRMHTEFSDKKLTIVGVYSNENDSVDDVKAYLEKAEYPFPIVKDKDGSLARHLGATMTPQAHLIDTAGVLRYRGSIDDNRYETRIRHHYLKDALVAVLNGKPMLVKETAAFGCTIHLPDRPTPAASTINGPTSPQSSETWALGKPDWIFEIKTLNKTPHGSDAINTHYIQTDFEKDMYVRAIDFQIENIETVIGITAIFGPNFMQQRVLKSDSTKINSLLPTNPIHMLDRTFYTWEPGTTPAVLPIGVGHLLQKEEKIKLKLKRHTIDQKVPRTIRIGLYFSKTPKTARLHKVTLSRNADQQNEVSLHQFKTDSYVFAAYLHKLFHKEDIKVLAVTPTGERIKMLWLKASDFKWRDIYYYQKPIFLPAGSRLEFDIEEDSENQNNLELSDQKNEKGIELICNFLYVFASEYTPD